MKRKYFALFFLCFVGVWGQRQKADSLFRLANEFFHREAYAEAERLYAEIPKTGYHAPELYYNAGRVAYRQNRLLDAVYYYEKALRLDPSYKPAGKSLDVVRRGLQASREALPEIFYKKWWKKFVRMYRSDVWTYTSFLFLLAALISLAVFLHARKVTYKKTAFYLFPFFVLLWLFFLFSAYSAYRLEHRNYAVAMKKEARLYDEPSLNSGAQEKLFPGEKIEILREEDFWAQIRLSDGKIGWTPKENYRKL